MTASGIGAASVVGSLLTVEAIRVAYFRPLIIKRGAEVLFRIRTAYVLGSDIALCVVLCFVLPAIRQGQFHAVYLIVFIPLIGVMIVFSISLRTRALVFQDHQLLDKGAFLAATRIRYDEIRCIQHVHTASDSSPFEPTIIGTDGSELLSLQRWWGPPELRDVFEQRGIRVDVPVERPAQWRTILRAIGFLITIAIFWATAYALGYSLSR